jgi:hypothetical protein
MNRKRWIGFALVLLLAFGVTLSAGAQAQKWGLVFNLWDVATESVASSDGISAGLGVKYWIAEKMALRGLLDFEHASNSAADTSSTYFGLSAAFEYHFKTGKVSPYAGGLVGVGILTGDTNDLALTLGGLLGVELRVMDALGLFAEYALSMYVNEPDFQLELGAGNNASIGVVVYLR